MKAIRLRRAAVAPLKPRLVLRAPLRKQIQRTAIPVNGIDHRLRLVAVRPGTPKRCRTVLITVTTDRTHKRARVHISHERLEDPAFVASLLAHAMRAVLMNELTPDEVEAL